MYIVAGLGNKQSLELFGCLRGLKKLRRFRGSENHIAIFDFSGAFKLHILAVSGEIKIKIQLS
jgi:hypothetical protein